MSLLKSFFVLVTRNFVTEKSLITAEKMLNITGKRSLALLFPLFGRHFLS